MNEKSHFGSKTVPEHLKMARGKGKKAMHDSHGLEIPDHLIAASDSAKEAAIITSLIWIVGEVVLIPFETRMHLVFLVLLGFLLWRAGRSAILGWARLERINRLIREEKHEITHNRNEEREELQEIYQAKGFQGELLTKVIDVLMADDNKLLGVMIEEEMGVNLEAYEHPLKLAMASVVGIFLVMGISFLGMHIHAEWGIFFTSYITIFIASWVVAKIERIRFLVYAVWNLGVTFLTTAGIYFLVRYTISEK